MRKKIIIPILVLLVIFTGVLTVQANEENGWFDWTGSAELAETKAVVTQLVGDIIALDTNLQSIEAQLDAWILEDGITEVQLDLNEDGTVTTTEKITVLKALSSSAAGGQTTLLLEVAALEAELIDINVDLDLIITTEGITVSGTETAEEKIALIETYISELNAEIIWLNAQLVVANEEAEQFKTDICTELDSLPAGIRGNYETWCPETP